ncbi:hypothetical protein EUX98_g6499, partial [Antrodiella citrinella]
SQATSRAQSAEPPSAVAKSVGSDDEDRMEVVERGEGEVSARSSRSEANKPLPAPPSDNPSGMSMLEPVTTSALSEDRIQDLADEGRLDRIAAGPVNTRAENILNAIDDAAGAATDSEGMLAKYVTPIKDILAASGATEAIEHGLNSFMEDIPWLMKGLDEVARIHPVVTVAVLAFKAVYSMEMTRRENNKWIWSLYVEMKDMIAVLIQLRDIKDPQDVGPDDRTIEARLQGLVKQTGDDVKDCANACDTYTKKRLLVKVLKGYVWETKLVGFVGTFVQRRTEFEQALMMHMARTMHAMEATLSSVRVTADAINEKMAMFVQAFGSFMTPEETEMQDLVMQKGDLNTLQTNETVLLELSNYESSEPRTTASYIATLTGLRYV